MLAKHFGERHYIRYLQFKSKHLIQKDTKITNKITLKELKNDLLITL